MKSTLLLIAGMALFAPVFSAEVYTGQKANNLVPGAEMVRIKDYTSVPNYIKFRTENQIPFSSWQTWINERYFKSLSGVSFELVSVETDRLGMTHYRYKQYMDGREVIPGMWIVHVAQGLVVSMNGDLFDAFPATSPSLGEPTALSQALAYVDAETYKWELEAEEEHLKLELKDPSATYFPKGELVYIFTDPTMKQMQLELAWRFNIYAHKPLSRKEVFVNAGSGNVIQEFDLIHHADSTGTAITGYLGQQTIITDYSNGIFKLRESGRGNGIETYNLNNSTNYGAATDFTDQDNYWNYSTVNKYALDAHFGAEQTYDFFYNNFNRNSIDNNGFTLRSYVHYNTNYGNAFWDGQRMTYGDGSNGNSPLTAIDITGHEITHGLTNFTADLVYAYESGALNESFSDIFGAAVEFYALGQSNGDWQMGEDIGFIIRYLNNPNLGGDPDTYGGTYWYTGSNDNGGVHTNSGVQNFWFYLLTTGGSGTNDLGNSYSVTGIGLTDAEAIAFRNLTVYLTSTSQYEDARFYAIQSAMDLFGACSQQVVSTGNAWYAVGVGGPYANYVDADFEASNTKGCTLPFTVDFNDLSSNATTYLWDFGDGNTSTVSSPSHTYTQAGVYTVKLKVSSTCGVDSTTQVGMVKVGPEYPCEISLAENGETPKQSGCKGVLYDNGGPNGNYLDQTDSYITIEPCGAASLTITFDHFNLESGGQSCQYDFLEVYDGPSMNSPLIGKYCNSNLPPATISATGSSLTIRMYADAGLNYSGFEISWECVEGNAIPEPDFAASVTETCDGEVHFTDLTENCPDNWSWDFGDGNTSTQPNPTHVYAQNGNYTVKLIASNSNGTDSIAKQSYILVNRPTAPQGSDIVEICPGESATLTASASGEVHWYNAANATVPFHTGDTFVTPNLNSSVSYFVESVEPGPSSNVGPADNNFGNGSNFVYNQYLIFDVFKSSTLETVEVYATGDGNRTIELRDASGMVLQSKTLYVLDGQQTLTLNFDLEPGTDYQLGVSNQEPPNLYRNSSGASYPYVLPGILSITKSSANNNPLDYYYFFYNWSVSTNCVSERKEVIASTSECLGIDELARDAFRVYPNPSRGQITISWDHGRAEQIEILNSSGQLVLNHRVSGLKTSQMTLELAGGVYYIRMVNSDGVFVKPLIVE
ncbi:MAG: hypothetical protein Kow0075_07710 [Salibacteraceae bacterium]